LNLDVAESARRHSCPSLDTRAASSTVRELNWKVREQAPRVKPKPSDPKASSELSLRKSDLVDPTIDFPESFWLPNLSVLGKVLDVGNL